MNKTVAIVLALVVVAAVGIPLAMKYAKPKGAAPVKLEGKPATEAAPQPVSNEPPYWNSGNFGGTVWSGTISGIKATLAFQAGGALKVTSDSPIFKAIAPSGELPGMWTIEGAKINIQIDVPNRGPQKMSGTISGKQLIDDKGKPLPFQQVQ